MKRTVLLILITLLYVLGGSSVLAKNSSKGQTPSKSPGQGNKNKGVTVTRSADRGKPPKNQPVNKTRTVRTRDPKTGRTVTKEVPVSGQSGTNAQQTSTRSRSGRHTVVDGADSGTVRTRTRIRNDRTTGQSIVERETVVSGQNDAAVNARRTRAGNKVVDSAGGDVVTRRSGTRRNDVNPSTSTGLGKDQKAASLAKQIEHESAKHSKRHTRMAEMLKVAEGKGDDKTAARIKKLMEREQQRYDKRRVRMNGRSEKPGSSAKPTNSPKPTGSEKSGSSTKPGSTEK